MDKVVETQTNESAQQPAGFGAPFGKPFGSHDATADAKTVAGDGARVSGGCIVVGRPCGVANTDK